MIYRTQSLLIFGALKGDKAPAQQAEVTVRKKSLFKETQPPMSKYDITLERCVTLSHHFWAVCVCIFAPAFV
jgi:hypothetical protein